MHPASGGSRYKIPPGIAAARHLGRPLLPGSCREQADRHKYSSQTGWDPPVQGEGHCSSTNGWSSLQPPAFPEKACLTL